MNVKISASWVPLVVTAQRCFIFPGVPHIFRSMLEDFLHVLPSSAQQPLFRRDLYIQTGEGEIARALLEVETLLKHSSLQIGSYPERIGVDESYQVRVSLQATSEDTLQLADAELRSRFPDFRSDPFGEVI